MASEISYGRRLSQLATDTPDEARLSVVARDGSAQNYSFRFLERRANQIARALAERGVGVDDVVAVARPNSIDHLLTALAVWKLGATMLPLRSDLPAWEMDRMLGLAEPKLLVSNAHAAACPVLTTDDLEATRDLPADPLPDRIAECVNLVASSGSTGLPKLVVTPNRGVVADDHTLLPVLGSSDPVILVTSPLYHVNGFAYTLPPLLEGARVYVMEKFDAARAVELIERHGITFTVMVPTMLQRIAKLDGIDRERFASIRRIIIGGAKVAEWVIDRFLELVPPDRLIFIYGSSERLGYTSMTGADWAAHRGATGRPQDVDIQIRGPDGRPLPSGEVGEIYMRPLQPRRLFRYIGVPTPEIPADGYATIGDLGWLDDDGFLYVADRRTDLILSGGANVYPAEVEAALSEHPDVFDQVVVGIDDDEWGQRVHAIVQPVDVSRPPTVDELRAYCKERLAAYKVPKSFEIVERIPRTEAGKLNRRELARDRQPAVSEAR